MRMKKIGGFLLLVVTISGCMPSLQERVGIKVGEAMPPFEVEAAHINNVEQFSLASLTSKYVMFFFYPKDFTFVCPTELWALQEKLEEFKAKDAQVVAVSTDSVQTHLEWLKTPKDSGGIQGITYPLLADPSRVLTRRLGILQELENIALRGTFLLKKEGESYILKHVTINDLPYGRNIDEFLRLVDAFEHHEQHGEVCPANWRRGKKAIEPTTESVAAYLKDEVK
jgi:peroxiredoxin (alkyl hydroperoxide reductase subunit C)